jgi:hypothetical protein
MFNRIRVIRIIEYVGPREWVERTVADSIHGTLRVGRVGFSIQIPDDAQITAVTLGEFPESIADSELRPRESGTCERCKTTSSEIVSARIRKLYSDVEEDAKVCVPCLRQLQARGFAS